MKNRLMKAIVAVTVLMIVPQIHAYRYSFANHTTKKIVAAIKFQGSKWYEYCVVQAGSMCTIGHGNKANKDGGEVMQTDIPTSSMGLVPSQFFFYVPKEGEIMTLAKQQTVGWRAVEITWVPSESYKLAIDLAQTVGKSGEAIGRTAAEAGAAYMTGGASALASAAKSKLVSPTKQTNAMINSQIAQGKADAVTAASKGEYGLSGLLGAIGRSAARSLIGDRHFDIIEDEDGKIQFMSRI